MAQQNDALMPVLPHIGRVDGWTRYHEYFHQLNSDMQKTTERAAMRRQGPTAASFFDDMELKPLKPVPMQSQHSSSSFFESIADAIRTHDKPLVHIEDAEDGSAKLGAGVSGIPGGRTLTDADLRVVRAQLRAAAHTSNLRAAQAAGQPLPGGGSESEWSAAGGPASSAAHPRKKEGGANGKKAAAGRGAASAAAAAGAAPPAESTAEAAMETLMWFGMALGDPAKQGAKQGGGLTKGAVPKVGSFVDLDQLSKCFDEHDTSGANTEDVTLGLASWDWVQAMAESGLAKEEEAHANADDDASATATVAAPSRSQRMQLTDHEAADEANVAALEARHHSAVERLVHASSDGECLEGGLEPTDGTERFESEESCGASSGASETVSERGTDDSVLLVTDGYGPWEHERGWHVVKDETDADSVLLADDGESPMAQQPAAPQRQQQQRGPSPATSFDRERQSASASGAGTAAVRIDSSESVATQSGSESQGASQGSSVQTNSPHRVDRYAEKTSYAAKEDASSSPKRSRSGRQIAPKRSLLLAMEAPLLKWEKEQQQRDKKAAKLAASQGGAASVGSGHSSSSLVRQASAASSAATAPCDTDAGDAHSDALVDDVLLASGLSSGLLSGGGGDAMRLLAPSQRTHAKRPRL